MADEQVKKAVQIRILLLDKRLEGQVPVTFDLVSTYYTVGACGQLEIRQTDQLGRSIVVVTLAPGTWGMVTLL